MRRGANRKRITLNASAQVICSLGRIRTYSVDVNSVVPLPIGPLGNGSCGRTRTYTPCGTRLTAERIYQFHHAGMVRAKGLEPPRCPPSKGDDLPISPHPDVLKCNGRDSRVRTCDLSSPRRTRYLAALYPDDLAFCL